MYVRISTFLHNVYVEILILKKYRDFSVESGMSKVAPGDAFCTPRPQIQAELKISDFCLKVSSPMKKLVSYNIGLICIKRQIQILIL